ncbi:hypothetical protein ACVIWV_009795 [Bradyrhizobium diazoefficiens]|nr:hypothetical protein GCM10007858_01010 [Bradyrhizobium liaoningense]
MTTKAFLSHFGLQTLRDLPDMEMLEEAGLLSKDKMLAGEFPVLASDEADQLEADRRRQRRGLIAPRRTLEQLQ